MENMKKGFVFGDDYDAYVDPHCDFCGKRYESIGVPVGFAHGFEICPSCILKGPKVVGTETTRRPPREFHSMVRGFFMQVKGFANKLKTIDDFRDLPGGILAVKIAEAYQETKAANRKKKVA